MSNFERPEFQALSELEQVAERVAEELNAFRKRAQKAEADRARVSEAVEASTDAERVARMERDNRELQQRVAALSEIVGWVDWLFADEITDYDEKSWQKAMVKGRAAADVLDEVITRLDADPFDDPAGIEAVVMGVGDELTESVGARVMSQAPVRVALTGRNAGLPLWQPMVLLGKDRCLSRLQAARARL